MSRRFFRGNSFVSVSLHQGSGVPLSFASIQQSGLSSKRIVYHSIWGDNLERAVLDYKSKSLSSEITLTDTYFSSVLLFPMDFFKCP